MTNTEPTTNWPKRRFQPTPFVVALYEFDHMEGDNPYYAHQGIAASIEDAERWVRGEKTDQPVYTVYNPATGRVWTAADVEEMNRR